MLTNTPVPPTTSRRTANRLGLALLVALSALSALFVPTAGAASARPALEVETVTSIADGSDQGLSVLHRNRRAIRAAVVTGGLERRHAYTVWAVVFNNPSACDGACDAADLADPDVDGVSTLLAGRVARRGPVVFTGRLGQAAGVTDPMNAEVHLIVRTHGRVIPDLRHEQLTTLNGGCPPNACANVQMAVHRP